MLGDTKLATQSNTTPPTNHTGEIQKCPNCGEILKAFETICPTCKYELRGVQGANSVWVLSEKLQYATSNHQRMLIIQNYPIPNTKEDIFELMFLAYSNFNVTYYASHLDEEDISDAWLSKIEQCYLKAKLTLSSNDFASIQELYVNVQSKIKQSIRKHRKKQFWHGVAKSWKTILAVIVGIAALTLILIGIGNNYYGWGNEGNPFIILGSIIGGVLTLSVLISLGKKRK